MSKKKLFAQRSRVAQFHPPGKISFFDAVQNMNSKIEEVLKPHVTRLNFEAKPADDIILEVDALGMGSR